MAPPEELIRDSMAMAKKFVFGVQAEVISRKPKPIKNIQFIQNHPFAVNQATEEEWKARKACNEYDLKVVKLNEMIDGWNGRNDNDFVRLLQAWGFMEQKHRLLKEAEEAAKLVEVADASCKHPLYANNR